MHLREEDKMNREIKFTKEDFEKLKVGDKDSFDLLYQEYYLVLFRTALLILGKKEDAEDVLQDTFVSIYNNVKTLSDFEKLRPWVFSILKNTSYTRYKKRKRELPDEFVLDKAEESPTYLGEDDFAEKSEIQDALMSLKEKEREVLVLYYYNDFSIEEIASICKTFQGTVKSRLYRARKNLKKELLKTNEEYEGELL